MSAGQLVYLRAVSGQWALADADAASTSTEVLGIVLSDAGGAAEEISVLISGLVSTTLYTITNQGDIVYVSQTAGNVTSTVPTVAGSIIRGVGQCLGINFGVALINFNPDASYFTNG